MSSTTSANAKPADALKPIKHVDILQTQASLLFANLHPVLLFSLIPISFKSLVRDPTNTLLGLAPTVLIIQALYCIICLPSTGQTPPAAQKPGQKKKSPKPAQDIWARLVPAFLSLVLTFTISAPLLCILVVLFGAPLVSHHLHTFLLAVHFALLTSPQLFYIHGIEAQTWMRIASLQQPVDEMYGQAIGACLGAWIGAIPIPLDWDREWQKWPVTIICGLYGGAVVGKIAGGYLFKGAKMKMN